MNPGLPYASRRSKTKPRPPLPSQYPFVSISIAVGLALTSSSTDLLLSSGFPYFPESPWSFVAFAAFAVAMSGAVHWLLARIVEPVLRDRPTSTALLLPRSFVAGAVPVAVELLRPPLAWTDPRSDPPGASVEATERASWGETHSAIEIHAITPDDSHRLFRVQAPVRGLERRRGARLTLHVTQPDWAVLDSLGRPFESTDGVEVFVAARSGRRPWQELVRQRIHAQARPEYRRWLVVETRLPPTTRELAIEASPGPLGSNNWNDRVYVRLDVDTASLATFANAVTIAFLVLLIVVQAQTLAANRQDRAVRGGDVTKRLLSAIPQSAKTATTSTNA